MANGGHISCEQCTYNRRKDGFCDIFGIETSPFLICRSFRSPLQSHQDARNMLPMLNKLEPGLVYKIDNSYLSIGNPSPVYKVSLIS